MPALLLVARDHPAQPRKQPKRIVALDATARRCIAILQSFEHVRVWGVRLDPGKTIDFHIHRHLHLIVSLAIFGDPFDTDEPLGATVFIDRLRPVHRLSNRASVQYLSRLIEIKHTTWSGDAVEESESKSG